MIRFFLIFHNKFIFIVERSDEFVNEYSWKSFYNVTHKSFSLFSIPTYGETECALDAKMLLEEERRAKSHFNGILRVRSATKFVAKKLNRIFTEVKTKMKKLTGNKFGKMHNKRTDANNNSDYVHLNRTTTLPSNSIESLAVDESVDDHMLYARDSCINSIERYSSSNHITSALHQSAISHFVDDVSVVPLIINTAQSRSPILFRPNISIKNAPKAPNFHHCHTLYEVCNDYNSPKKIDERLNSIYEEHSTECDGIGKIKVKWFKLLFPFYMRYKKMQRTIIATHMVSNYG